LNDTANQTTPDAHSQTAPRKRLSPRLLRQRERTKSALTVLLVTALLAASVLLTAWPWPKHFLTGLPAGAEAPRDAWQLSWGAHRLLAGQVLPGHDAPAFYPHAGALDFDELLYVPSVAALAPYAATGDPVLTYNVTLLAFWVLSGLMMYLFLRELGIGRAGCVFGAVAFALVPWRTAEFYQLDVQLCFGVPLCLMLLARWVRTQERRWAFFVALALWAQAMSVLGYALALMIALPLVAIVGLVRRRPSPFDDRPLYDGVAITGVVLLILASVFLGPAIELRTSDALTRMYEERHEGGVPLFPYLFPGAVVLLLAAVYGFFQRQMLFKHVRAKRPGQIIITALAVARVALWVFVALTCAGRAVAPDAAFWETLGRAVGGALVAILALTFVLALAARRAARAFGTALMHGLGLAAAACFIASLGPQITVGSPAVDLSQGPLPGPGIVHAFLGTIAPLSRLGIIPIIFLVTAAAWILDEVAHHRRFRWVPIPALILVCTESLIMPNSFEPAGLANDSPVMQRLANERETRTVLGVPAGDAEMDARWLLASAGRFNLMVNGSETISPPAYRELAEAFRSGDVEAGSAMLKELWPDPYLLVDRAGLEERDRVFRLDENQLAYDWELVIEDSRYALYEPVKETLAPYVIRKRVRPDLASRFARLRIKARMKFTDVSLDPYVVARWNDQGDQSFVLTSEFQSLEFDARAHWLGRPEGDVVTIELMFKVDGAAEFTPAEEALAGKRVGEAWEVSEIDFWEAPRR